MLKLRGIRLRLWLATALPAMLMIALLVVGWVSLNDRRMTAALKDRGAAEARQLGSAAEFMLFAGDREGLRHLADAAIHSDSQLRSVVICDAQGHILVSAGQSADPLPPLDGVPQIIQQRHLSLVQPIHATAPPTDDPYTPTVSRGVTTQQLLGYAVVELSLEDLAQQRQDLMIWAVATTLGGLAVTTLLSSVIASRVTRQIVWINRVVARVGRGQLDARVNVDESGMLSPLAEGINAMISRIEAAHHDLHRQIDQATHELRRQKDAAEQAARTDALTRVASRRAFDEAVELERQRALRYRTPLALLMLDMDHFKAINDRHGHVSGDAVLVSFAQTMLQQVRKVDTVARLGGEEFVVLLPNIGMTQATTLAERIRLAVERSEVDADGRTLRFTVSIGVAPFDPAEATLTEWLARADAALYQAKAQGRNCVVQDTGHQPPPPPMAASA